MRHDGVADATLYRGDAAENLLVRAGRGRDVLERREGVLPVLRGLGDDRIGHAVLRVEPERRRRLDAAGKRVLQVLRHVALAHPDQLGAGAVDVDIERRRVEGLLDARVRDAGHPLDFGQNHVGVGAVGLDVRADNLHVDRRREAEVKDLGDDVGGQEREVRSGKLARQVLAASPSRSRARRPRGRPPA